MSLEAFQYPENQMTATTLPLSRVLPLRSRAAPGRRGCQVLKGNSRNWKVCAVWGFLFCLIVRTSRTVQGADGSRSGTPTDEQAGGSDGAAGRDGETMTEGDEDGAGVDISGLSAHLYSGVLRTDVARRDRNLVIAPFSLLRIYLALEEGAGGDTLEEMRVHMDDTRVILDVPHFSQYIPPTAYRLAELLYVRSDPGDEHLALYRERQQAAGISVELFDFLSPGSAAEGMNARVRDETSGLIGEAILPEAMPARPDITAVNAAVLQAHWLKPFSGISRGVFHALGGQAQNLPFMGQVLVFPMDVEVLEEGEVVALRLPLADPRLGMYIVMPENFGPFTESLAADPTLINVLVGRVSDLATQMKRRQLTEAILVKLPLFYIRPEHTITNMLPVLRELGVASLEAGQADFSNMSTHGRNLGLDIWSHGATINVNENGLSVDTPGQEPFPRATGPLSAEVVDGAENVITVDKPFYFEIRFQPRYGGLRVRENEIDQDIVLISGQLVDAYAAESQ